MSKTQLKEKLVRLKGRLAKNVGSKNAITQESATMKIIIHDKKHENRHIIHTAIVESERKPSYYDVSLEVGYHPCGYNASEISCSSNNDGTWTIVWTTWDSCD